MLPQKPILAELPPGVGQRLLDFALDERGRIVALVSDAPLIVDSVGKSREVRDTAILRLSSQKPEVFISEALNLGPILVTFLCAAIVLAIVLVVV